MQNYLEAKSVDFCIKTPQAFHELISSALLVFVVVVCLLTFYNDCDATLFLWLTKIS